MMLLLRSWRDFARADFRWGLYGATFLFLAVAIAFNYVLDFEDSYIDAYRETPWRFPAYYALYALAYYPTALLWARAHGQTAVLRKRAFWVFSAFGLAVLAFWRDFFFYQYLAEVPPFRQVYTLAFRCLSNLSSVLTVFLPFALFYRFVAQPRTHFYGFKPYRPALGVYALLLAAMVPLIGWASFQPDFLETYPTFRDWDAFAVLGTPAWVPPLVYELCYGFDFISTELIFRGFFVVGMAHLLGRGYRPADGRGVRVPSLRQAARRVRRVHFRGVPARHSGLAEPQPLGWRGAAPRRGLADGGGGFPTAKKQRLDLEPGLLARVCDSCLVSQARLFS
jgi:hypothetical protein